MHLLILVSRISIFLTVASLNNPQARAQYQALSRQTDTFNSSVIFNPTQQRRSGINATLANNIAIALNFERSNFAHGPAESEDFYYAPANSSQAAPGTLLKLELDANTSAYTLPPNTALSRILFQSENLNGTQVPASAYILWPYLPRTQTDGFPVIAWAHGTSGLYSNCAPSEYRNLLYQYATVFELVLQGYVVVAPDYQGLGVAQNANGKPVVHPYLGSPSHANDLFYSVQAARVAFSSLSKNFVVMGHSQGGGAAWAATVRQAQNPVDGYLGAVVGSPVTNFISLSKMVGSTTQARQAAFMASTISDLNSSFKSNSVLTPAGLRRLNLFAELQGCLSTAGELFADQGLFYTDWLNNSYVQAYNELINPAGKPIAGPMLVLQGLSDRSVPEPVTTEAVRETCAQHPDSQLQYSTFAGVSHVPVMFASQRLWLDWIHERFAGMQVASGCQSSNYSSTRSYQYYQKEQNWFVEFATAAYETA